MNSTLNAHRMYISCVNEAAIEVENIDVILPFINEQLGGWPILRGSTWNSSTFNLSRRLLTLAEHSNSVLFDVNTQIDQQNSSIRSIRLGQSGLALGSRENYFSESDVTRAYREFIRKLARALTNDTSMIDKDVNEIYTFEQTIARFVRTSNGESIRTTIDHLPTTINTNVSISSSGYILYGHSV